jgi:hypothetical protein
LHGGISGERLRVRAGSALDARLCLLPLLVLHDLLRERVVFFGCCGGLRLLRGEDLGVTGSLGGCGPNLG